MNSEAILRAADACRAVLTARVLSSYPYDRWLTAERAGEEYLCGGLENTRTRIRHVLHCLDRIAEFVAAGRTEKAFRWLGFVQGYLWTIGASTIGELGRMNMPVPAPPEHDQVKTARFLLKALGKTDADAHAFLAHPTAQEAGLCVFDYIGHEIENLKKRHLSLYGKCRTVPV